MNSKFTKSCLLAAGVTAMLFSCTAEDRSPDQQHGYQFYGRAE